MPYQHFQRFDSLYYCEDICINGVKSPKISEADIC